jgi:hypothetical protein
LAIVLSALRFVASGFGIFKPSLYIKKINIGTVLLILFFIFSRVSFTILLGYSHVFIFSAITAVQGDQIISTDHVTIYTSDQILSEVYGTTLIA